MKKIVLRDYECRIGSSCPEITRAEGGYELVGKHIPDPSLPEDERRIFQPESMHPELARLEIEDFDAWLREHRKTPGDILRIQTLPAYEVESDGGDFAAYVQGLPGPSSPDREPFFAQLREERAKDMIWRDLTVVNGQLTDYQRYGFDWVCPDAVGAGQVIRVLDVAEVPAAAPLLRLGDFWVVEGEHVVLVRYDAQGRHLGEVEVEAQSRYGYIAAAEMAWALGTDFSKWWHDHPEYRRVPRAG